MRKSNGFYRGRKLFILLASMLPWVSSAQAHEFKVHKNIVWASPKDVSLTADIYVPATGKKKYPVLVIYHGGGWLIILL